MRSIGCPKGKVRHAGSNPARAAFPKFELPNFPLDKTVISLLHFRHKGGVPWDFYSFHS